MCAGSEQRQDIARMLPYHETHYERQAKVPNCSEDVQ